jgi:hypothetical protein
VGCVVFAYTDGRKQSKEAVMWLVRIGEWFGKQWRYTQEYFSFKEKRSNPPALIWLFGVVVLLIMILLIWF